MADITMCHGRGCPLREDCWRYKATPTSIQAYAAFDDEEGGGNRRVPFLLAHGEQP